jgi:hypothetical protein
MVTMEQHCSQSVLSIIEEAVAAGDLSLAELDATDIVFGLWSITVGFHRLVQSFDDPAQVGVSNAFAGVHKNYRLLLDSYGWQPRQGWDPVAVEHDFRQNILSTYPREPQIPPPIMSAPPTR